MIQPAVQEERQRNSKEEVQLQAKCYFKFTYGIFPNLLAKIKKATHEAV